jgi:hypothetical protein
MKRFGQKKIVEYLRNAGIPYKIVNDKNVLVLRSNSRYHYCMVEFLEMSQEWYDKQNYFKFKRIFPGQRVNSIIIKLNEYLYEDKSGEINYGGESTQKQVSKA